MTYAPLGPTHQAIDDFALMRSIPNMRIFAPADPRECRSILQYLCRSTFPAYVRIARGGEPNFLGALSDLDPGKGRYVFQGEEIAVLSTGSISFECFTAVKGLREAGLSVSFAHFPCVEPLDGNLIAEIGLECKEIIVVEEHMASGGLFSAVTEFLARSGVSATLHQVSLPRAFASNFGSQREHWDAHGLSAPQITNLLLQISKRRSNDG